MNNIDNRTPQQQLLAQRIHEEAQMALIDRGDLLLIADAPLEDRIAIAEYWWGPGGGDFLR